MTDEEFAEWLADEMDRQGLTRKELAEKSGDVVDGVRYQKNGKDGSRYHTNWLNMMYPRLKIAY